MTAEDLQALLRRELEAYDHPFTRTSPPCTWPADGVTQSACGASEPRPWCWLPAWG